MIWKAKRIFHFFYVDWSMPVRINMSIRCSFFLTAAQFLQLWCVALIAMFFSMAALPALAYCPNGASGRFVPNGTEVKDTKTGLIWARCSIGQDWDGANCVGTAEPMHHEQALAYARGQADWRLPDVKELSSLVDRGCKAPAIDTKVFPNTPGTLYWTTTPMTGNVSKVWVVEFNSGRTTYEKEPYGFAGSGRRTFGGAVRLVRVAP